jgi:hypothetical protein
MGEVQNFGDQNMASREQQNKSAAEKAVWPLLFLTAALQAYLGLSLVAYAFMGVSNPASGLGGLTVATTGGLQTIAALVAFVLAVRRDLRGTTLALAGSILLGWFSILPSVAEQGLDFGGEDWGTPVYFVLSPIIAIVAGTLAWRNLYPVAAAIIVTAPTFAGILFVIAFAIIIARYGF